MKKTKTRPVNQAKIISELTGRVEVLESHCVTASKVSNRQEGKLERLDHRLDDLWKWMQGRADQISHENINAVQKLNKLIEELAEKIDVASANTNP